MSPSFLKASFKAAVWPFHVCMGQIMRNKLNIKTIHSYAPVFAWRIILEYVRTVASSSPAGPENLRQSSYRETEESLVFSARTSLVMRRFEMRIMIFSV